MHLRPFPCWYVYAIDATAPIPLLTDDGQASPDLSTESLRRLADLAAAIHAAAWQLSESELHALERFIALQRWRR
jgi:hypothetical protein